MIADRYHQHGLRANPFAVPQPIPSQPGSFIDRGLPDPPGASSATLVQVIGDKGAGKSTQVFEWQRREPGPYHYVPPRPYRSRWARPPIADLVYADEIDRMPVPLRSRWFRKLAVTGATVVAGTHVNLASVAHRAGLAVVTHRLGPASVATVRAVLEARVLQASIVDVTSSFRLTNADIVDLHARSQGSLRTAEVLAHELVAQRVHAEVMPTSNIALKVAQL